MQLLDLVLRECIKELIFIQVYDFTCGQASYAAPPLNSKEHLLIAEERASLDLS